MAVEMKKESVSVCMDNTLKQLGTKGEGELFYTVAEKDLLKLDCCPLCDSKKLEIVSEVKFSDGMMFFATATCGDCLHVFRNVAPRRQWFQERWKQISTGKLEVFNPTLEEDRVTRYKFYYSLLSRFLKKGTVLDVGAAYGSGARFFQSRGFTVEAIEPEDDRAKYINEVHGIKAHHGALEDQKFADGKFDAILFAHCLEHLDDPKETLGKLRDWLNPETGIIYLEVPLLWNVVDWRDAFFMAHKHNFTESNLEKLAAELGLKIIEKFMVPDSEGDFDNIGMLLTRSDRYKADNPITLSEDKGSSAKDVCDLYRREMPYANDLKSGVLHYSVPYMNHFYYIVRLPQGEFRPAAGENCFEFVRTDS